MLLWYLTSINVAKQELNALVTPTRNNWGFGAKSKSK